MRSFYFLSTIDNPYSPITQFDDWYAYDVHKGYNSCALLSRVVESKNKSFDELSQAEQSLVVANAIDEIVGDESFGYYTKILFSSSSLNKEAQ